MHCQHCHADCPENHSFCSDCGKPLKKEAKGTLWIPALILAVMFAAGFLVWYLL